MHQQHMRAWLPQALVGEDMFDDSACLLNGTEMRPKVAYLLGSGAKLRFGGWVGQQGCRIACMIH